MAGAGRGPMSAVTDAGIALLAARVASALGRPLSSAGGWMPRARSRRSASASTALRCAASISSLTVAIVVVIQLLPGHAEVHGQRGQPHLRAVVQVPLDPAQRRGGVFHRQRPGPLQLADPSPARPEQAADQPPGPPR